MILNNIPLASLVILGIGFLLMIPSTWILICGMKTAKHRLQIIEWVFAHANYEELLDYFKAVSHHEHTRALIWFRDPFKLYDPELFSTFHLIKYGPSFSETIINKEIICPYTPE